MYYGSLQWHSDKPCCYNPLNEAFDRFWKICGIKEVPPDILRPELHLMLIDLLFAHDVYHKKTPLKFESLFKFASAIGRRDKKLRLQNSKDTLQCRRNTFSKRIIPAWNAIPDEILLGTREGLKLYLTQNQEILKLRRSD